MYPLKVILVGSDESLLPNVRRELLNQHVEIDQEFPDVLSTLENLSLHHDESRLFICHINGDQQKDMLRRLSGAFAGRPIVALIERDLNSASILHAMRDGASQVVLLPLDMEDFREAISRVGLQHGHVSSKSKVIAVTGAHGGAGATTLAVNLAYELAQIHHLDTIVAELSLSCGVLASHLNIKPQFTTLELLQNSREVDAYSITKALVPFGERLSVLAGPTHVVKAPNLTPATVSQLIHCLRQLATVVILDVPSTLDDAQLTALDAADEVVLVADQTLPSLQLTIEALRLGIRPHSPWVVINEFDSRTPGLDIHRIKNALSIDEIHIISLDHAAVRGSANCGNPLRLSFPKSKALADIDVLAQDLMGVVAPVKASGSISKLCGSIGHALGIC